MKPSTEIRIRAIRECHEAMMREGISSKETYELLSVDFSISISTVKQILYDPNYPTKVSDCRGSRRR